METVQVTARRIGLVSSKMLLSMSCSESFDVPANSNTHTQTHTHTHTAFLLATTDNNAFEPLLRRD